MLYQDDYDLRGKLKSYLYYFIITIYYYIAYIQLGDYRLRLVYCN